MDFATTSIGILGRGREGKSTYDFLIKQGVAPTRLTIYDEKLLNLADLPVGVQAYLGPFDAKSILKNDTIFLAPGITLHMLQEKIHDQDLFEQLRPKLTSQTQYFFDHFAGTVIGVTGTKGKSTISTLIYLMLKHAGKNVQLVGNVGNPVLHEIDRTQPPAIVVYELSSFMLETLCFGAKKTPLDIGILNTLYPAHTKEHGTHASYIAAKQKILKFSNHKLIGYQATTQLPENLISTQDLIYGRMGKRTFHDGIFRDQNNQLFSDSDTLLLGEHNRYNICAVIGVCQLLKIDLHHLQAILQTFQGLEHRIEYVGTYGGIKRYNDAIATTPQATIAAIESFKDELDTIFLGGIEGNYEFSGVADLLKKYKVPHIILFPDTGPRIKQLLDPNMHTFFETRSMHEAVVWAAKHTTLGKVALLSSGSPSFSLRSGFQEKGNLFKESIYNIENKMDKGEN